jgi:hypothetical protein
MACGARRTEETSSARSYATRATDLSRAYGFDRDGRYALLVAVMERDGAPLGFHFDISRSRVYYPIFWKQVTEHWGLYWTFEDPDDMLFWNPFEGRFRANLKIGSRALRYPDKAELGELLSIRYSGVIPGFYNAYMTFFGLDELETIIKAHLCLYGLMAPVIEKSLKAVLCADIPE